MHGMNPEELNINKASEDTVACLIKARILHLSTILRFRRLALACRTQLDDSVTIYVDHHIYLTMALCGRNLS